MRASPRISVLGEKGIPCIADNGTSEDHITVLFSWRWLHFSLTVADVRDLDNCGGVGHGNLPAAAGDSLPCSHMSEN